MNLLRITSPILVELLRKSEVHFPEVFLVWCRLTVGRLKRRTGPTFPAELVDLAILPIWVYINLKDRIGQHKAVEIMRVAILTGGVAQWNFAYRTVEQERTFKNLCDMELEVNKTGVTRWNTMRIVDRAEARFEISVTKCRYHELCVALGVPELTPVICQIDNAAFNSYLPDEVVFTRGTPGRRIADGAKECTFVWERRLMS